MAVGVNIDLKTGNGRDISAFQQILELRKKELGNTTAQSCIALVINILKSLRADTSVAKENRNMKISVVERKDYHASWKKSGNYHARCLRSLDGTEVNEDKVIWNVGKYRRGEAYKVYEVTDQIGDNKTIKYLLVSESKGSATDYAKGRHNKAVRRYKGLARMALGKAMYKVHSSEMATEPDINVGTLQMADKVSIVNNQSTGFDSGKVDISVSDTLDYAALALRSGEGYVEVATQKALNKMTGLLIHTLHNRGIQTSLKIPFEELKDR